MNNYSPITQSLEATIPGNDQLQVSTALRKYTNGNLLSQDGIQDMISHGIKRKTTKPTNYIAQILTSSCSTYISLA